MYQQRFLKFKLTIIIIVFLSVFIFCSSHQTADSEIQKQLTIIATSFENTDSFTSLLLLSNLALKPETIHMMEDAYEKENDHARKLFISFVLAKRTQEQKHIDNFIKIYPSGKEQTLIRDILINKTDYICISSPLQSLLANYAKNNKQALQKIISGYSYADGADAEILEQQLLNIYKANESLFIQVVKEENINLSEIGIQ